MKILAGNKIRLFAAATLGLGIAASAQAGGVWSGKAGINQIVPYAVSGDMTAPSLPGTQLDIGSDAQPFISISYAFDKNFSGELTLGAPYKLDLYGAGSISGTGKLGKMEALPASYLMQLRFPAVREEFQPYLGLGLSYFLFQKETGSGALTALTNTGGTTPTTFKVDSTWGLTTQAGFIYEAGENWYTDFSMSISYVGTQAHFSTGQSVDLVLNPLAVSFAIGRHF